jgi:hypothetical protein
LIYLLVFRAQDTIHSPEESAVIPPGSTRTGPTADLWFLGISRKYVWLFRGLFGQVDTRFEKIYYGFYGIIKYKESREHADAAFVDTMDLAISRTLPILVERTFTLHLISVPLRSAGRYKMVIETA